MNITLTLTEISGTPISASPILVGEYGGTWFVLSMTLQPRGFHIHWGDRHFFVETADVLKALENANHNLD